MADVKWIKIVTNIFDDEKIRYIETLPNGDETIVIWFKILCLAGKSNSSGLLMMTDRIAYTDQMLSSIFNRDIKSIQLALNVFESLEMIEMMENRICLTNWGKHQSLEKLEAKKLYDREYQKTKRTGHLLNNRTTIVRQEYDNRTLDKELDIEIDKDKTKIGRFTPPSLDEVTDYAKEKHQEALASKFYDYYSTGDWKDAKGNKVKNWKQKFITWTGRQNNGKQRVEMVTDYTTDPVNFSEEELNQLKADFKQIT